MAKNKTHGLSKKIPEYAAWENMKRRCYYPKHNRFDHYGGRGIIVCERWKYSFVNFLSDMGMRPSPKHSLDRIDVNKNYEPQNCKWSTAVEQANNKTTTRYLTINEQTKSITEWANIYKIKPLIVLKRIGRGWPLDERLFKITGKHTLIKHLTNENTF